jgi:broad specificity phosphatase PhoE
MTQTHQLNPSLNGSFALLIRHAEREPITTEESVWNAKLTSDGHSDAARFGKTLTGFKPGAVYSSPIPRCIDTASRILEGWGHKGIRIEQNRLLLDAYIKDGPLAGDQFKNNDPYELILRQLAGKDVPGFYTVKDGSVLLLNAIKKLMQPGKLTLLTTHDALIMPFRTYYLGDTFNKSDWFPFLGSVSIRIDLQGETYINEQRIS